MKCMQKLSFLIMNVRFQILPSFKWISKALYFLLEKKSLNSPLNLVTNYWQTFTVSNALNALANVKSQSDQCPQLIL